jgi:hypothetical protein
MVGRQTLEIEFLKGALKSGRSPLARKSSDRWAHVVGAVDVAHPFDADAFHGIDDGVVGRATISIRRATGGQDIMFTVRCQSALTAMTSRRRRWGNCQGARSSADVGMRLTCPQGTT